MRFNSRFSKLVDLMTRYAVYSARPANAIIRLIPNPRPAWPKAQGILRRDVPIIVFHMEKIVIKLCCFPSKALIGIIRKYSGGRTWFGINNWSESTACALSLL